MSVYDFVLREISQPAAFRAVRPIETEGDWGEPEAGCGNGGHCPVDETGPPGNIKILATMHNVTIHEVDDWWAGCSSPTEHLPSMRMPHI